jgi:flavin reductase (DIM6/NTAB) family NADH-FMN oxidoreductase RutF
MTAAELNVTPTRIHPMAFRAALRRHPAAVAVITGKRPGEPRRPIGFTATSVTSASLSPPLVSFYVGSSSDSWTALRGVGHFAVNLLAEHQAELASGFARKTHDRFAGVQWNPGPLGVPLLGGAALHLVCQRRSAIPVGDHTLVVGLVVHSSLEQLTGTPQEPPLLYHDGQYGRLERLEDEDY